MDFYCTDYGTRERWRIMATRDAQSERREFWRNLPDLPFRPNDGHKGTFGVTLVVAGSRGMSGAAGLVGAAALRAGSGLTRVVVPEAIQDTVAGYAREYTTIGAPCDASGRFTEDALELILDEARSATVVAVGPGLGRSQALSRLVVNLFFSLPKPAIFDADALNALAACRIFDEDADPFEEGASATLSSPRRTQGARVLTPHPGEFQRLFGFKPSGDYEARVCAASDAALKTFRYPTVATENRNGYEGSVVALKGAGTVIAQASTQIQFCEEDATTETNVVGQYVVNYTGNANLSTGGSGDVLTGIVAGLMAQGLGVMSATRLGVALHGIAAELRTRVASRGAVASDIIAFLPYAFDYVAIARETARKD